MRERTEQKQKKISQKSFKKKNIQRLKTSPSTIKLYKIKKIKRTKRHKQSDYRSERRNQSLIF